MKEIKSHFGSNKIIKEEVQSYFDQIPKVLAKAPNDVYNLNNLIEFTSLFIGMSSHLKELENTHLIAAKQLLLQAHYTRLQLYHGNTNCHLGNENQTFSYTIDNYDYYAHHLQKTLELSIICHAEKALSACIDWTNAYYANEQDHIKNASMMLLLRAYAQGGENIMEILDAIQNSSNENLNKYELEQMKHLQKPALSSLKDLLHKQILEDNYQFAQNQFIAYWSRNKNMYGNPGITYEESFEGLINWPLTLVSAIAEDQNIALNYTSPYTPEILFSKKFSVDIDSTLEFQFAPLHVDDITDILGDLGIDL